MREFLLVFKQAFVTKARTKSFIITTAIMMIAIFLMANISSIIGTVQEITGGKSEEVLHVIDKSNVLIEPLKIQFEESGIDLIVESHTETEEVLSEQVREGELDSFLAIDFALDHTIQAKYISMKSMEFTLPMIIEDALQSIQMEMKAEEMSLSQAQVHTLLAPIQFEQQSISPSAKSEEELDQARGLVYVLMFLIYFAVIFYSSMIATEVANEKSSRVMEVLISSISPTKHMFAKVFGIGTLGLVQIALLGVSGYVALKTTSSDLAEGMFSFLGFGNTSFSTIVYAIVFFLLGYFLYAMLAALLGSLVSRTEDVQQVIMPIMFLVIIAFIIAMTGLGNPDMVHLKYTSYFPFFAPLVMFLRIGMLDLPLWEPLLSIGIMILTILVLGWFGSRVYRGGVLMYGPTRSLKDLKKAIQLGKE